MMKKVSILMLVALMVVTAVPATETKAAKKESREVMISVIKGNIVFYYKAQKASKFIANAKKGEKVGSGKRKQIKITGKTKYYVQKSKKEKVRMSKDEFKKSIGSCVRHISGSRQYYTGKYCKIKLVGGKCTKITQQYQE